MNRESGFTLIELSIVLVVIGLLIGGVLMGQDMVRSAGIRGTIGQIEKLNTTVHAFQAKYGYLPGDIPSSRAKAFGLYYVSGTILMDTLGYGNGDGIIQGYPSAPWMTGGTYAGEIAMFFLHLSQSGLLEGAYGVGADVKILGATVTGGSYTNLPMVSVNTPLGSIGELLPPAKMGNGNYFTIGSVNSTNYFVLSGIWKIDTGDNVYSTNNITPLDAAAIDAKIDDGIPDKGLVFALDTIARSISNSNGTGLLTAAANSCVNNGAYYTTNATYAAIPNCSLRFDFQ